MLKYIKNKYIGLFLLAIVLLTIVLFAFIKFKNNNILFGDEMVQIKQENETENQENNDIKINDNKNLNEEKTTKITVYITGEVSTEGVITLESGSRLDDGIKKLGGVTKEADLNSINLAMIMEDGQHYIVPNKNNMQMKQNENVSNEKQNENISNENQNSNQKNNKELININNATQEELESLPGVGPSTAKKIIDYREKEKFNSVEDIKNVTGIGDKKFESMKSFISVN